MNRFHRLLAVAICLVSTPLLASPGDLDTSFAGSGKLVSSYGGTSQFGPAVKVQPDQKIVAVGKQYNDHDDDFLVQRFLGDGTPDPSFGSGGATVIKLSNSDDNAKALDFQSDGKIVIAGGAGQPGSYETIALARVTAAGVADTSFGAKGYVLIDFGLPSHAHSVVVQSDGKILVTGESYTSGDGGMVVVARLLSNGALDTSFGVDGKVAQTFGSAANGHALVLQTDGKLLIGGYATIAETGKPGFLVARFLANGTLDTSFGSNGSSTISVGTGNNYCHALMLQGDGKIVLSGSAVTATNYDFVLVRFNSDGSLDTGFGTSGVVTTNFASSPRPSIEETAGGAIQSDGKIVAGGYSDQKFALARYLTNGALDTSFGTGGMVTTVIGTNDWIKSLALQPQDGKVVAVGFSKNDTTYNLAIARYLNDCCQTISFGRAPTIVVGGTGTVSATATSGLPVTFSSATTSVCTVSGGIVSGVGSGTCTILANQAGDANNAAAATATLTITSYPTLADCVFSWAERAFPEFFAPAVATSSTAAPYYYRYYSGTQTYLATSSADNHIWAYGPVTGNSPLDVGSMTSFLATAGCSQ